MSKSKVIDLLNHKDCTAVFKNYDITTIILFGSIVTENFTEDSDVDIAILSSRKLSINESLSLEEMIEKKLNREIDIIDLKDVNTELSMKVTIFDEGEIIYNSDELEDYKNEYRDTEMLYKDNETFRYFRERDVIWDE